MFFTILLPISLFMTTAVAQRSTCRKSGRVRNKSIELRGQGLGNRNKCQGFLEITLKVDVRFISMGGMLKEPMLFFKSINAKHRFSRQNVYLFSLSFKVIGLSPWYIHKNYLACCFSIAIFSIDPLVSCSWKMKDWKLRNTSLWIIYVFKIIYITDYWERCNLLLLL